MTIETPAVIIDLRTMQRNIDKMADLAKENGVQLRPHIKTHKIPAFARRQMEAGATGVTAAKLTEAEVMVSGGIRDIFVAYPIVVPSKIAKAIQLSRRVRLIVGVDSLEGAKALSAAAQAAGLTMEIRMEVDTGLKRTGVAVDDALALGLSIAALPGLKLSGIFTYKGAVHQGVSTLDLAAAGREEGKLMVAVAEQLRLTGIAIKDVSVGSTPTAMFAAQVQGVTEIRPGTYIFNDRMQAQLGACSLDECAAKVVVSVVSVQPEGVVVVDGGSKTFATDVQPNQAPLNLRGFGAVLGYPDAVLERMNEEHGMIRINAPHDLKIGETLEIVPNHICSTVNLHNIVYAQEEGGGLTPIAVSARGQLQ